MTQTQHTPGPWHIGMQPGPIIYGTRGEQVADLRGKRKTLVVELDEAVANTRLIASAPDLLAALEIAQNHLVQYRRYSEEMRKIGRGLSLSSQFQEEYADKIIRDAIAAAKGRT